MLPVDTMFTLTGQFQCLSWNCGAEQFPKEREDLNRNKAKQYNRYYAVGIWNRDKMQNSHL